MPYYTPLRYPGGKRRLTNAVIQLLQANGLHDVEYVEPYAGGAAIALALLFEEHASVIHINDLSRPVFAFWHSVLHESADLCRMLELITIDVNEWERQRKVYENHENADLLDLGFATLFLNRTNRSGIINGGIIGGKDQMGAWKIGARFNVPELIQRIKKIGRFAERIRLTHQDALQFTRETLPLIANSFVFYDAPYIKNGENLYLNDYSISDHRSLEEAITEIPQNWVLTYDFGAIENGLYSKYRRMTYGLGYSARSRYVGNEVMFFGPSVVIPASWTNEPFNLSTSTRHTFYGVVQPLLV